MSFPNPNQTLSEQITKKLIEKGLVSKSSEKKIAQALNQGTMRESDWKVFLEEIINTPKNESNENK